MIAAMSETVRLDFRAPPELKAQAKALAREVRRVTGEQFTISDALRVACHEGFPLVLAAVQRAATVAAPKPHK